QPPDLPGTAHPAAELAVPEHPLDLHNQLRIALRPRRRRSRFERVVARRGDLDAMPGEHAADRLDPEPVTVIVDESHYQGSRGSSSRAKNEEAANKISLARLSSRTSPSRALMRAASLVVVPGRSPASIAACRHHPRRVSGLTPTRCPIRTTAAFNDNPGSSRLASCTSRIARSRNSC